MGNSFAYFALIAWPVISISLFNLFNVRVAIILSIFGGYLFLPASFEINLPGIPAFNKATVTTITIFVVLFFKGKDIGFKSLDRGSMIVLFMLILSPFITAMLNSEQYMHISGVSLYDGLSQAVSGFLIFIPFLLGAKYYNDNQSQKLILKSLVIFCLIYIPFVLYEVRMSPQIHKMVYGFFPHSFLQQMRAGGFRPVVFLGHGLLVAFFISIASIALVALIKSKIKFTKINVYFLFFIFLVALILSKTYGALILFLFSFVALLFLRLRSIAIICLLMTMFYVLYPVLSSSGFFPRSYIVGVVESVNPDRAQSLDFRFHHEEQLLFHANRKPLFGWSSWGRNRIYDPETFEDISVTDGRWIITLGTRGWFGFFTEFYFIFIAIFSAFVLSRKKDILNNSEKIILSGHMLIVTMVLIDQIPNSSLSFFYWLIIGSLYGYSKSILKER